MSQQAADGVLVYADYVCPFCYLGYVSLDDYRDQREEPLAADWHPFDLRAGQRRPDGSIDDSVETGKDEQYYEQARENVERLAEKYDIEMAQQLRKDVDSRAAQRVAWRAHDEYPDEFATFHRSVFDALWEDGRDIGDEAVLGELATAAGLPDGYVADALADPASEDDLEEAFERAKQAGVTGVPTFVADGHAARGAVPPEQLQRLVEGT